MILNKKAWNICSLKYIDERRNYLTEEINQNDISKKHKVCTAFNYIMQLVILVSAITGCVSISGVASLFGIPVVIASFAVGLNICVITAGIKKCKSIIKKHKKRKHDSIVGKR